MTSRRFDADRVAFYDGVGAAIREARVAAGLSQREFATKIGVTYGMVTSVESNHTPCSLYLASQIAELFDTTIDAIAPVQIAKKETA
jgi:DNA-binding XRE family transcriptional regulator